MLQDNIDTGDIVFLGDGCLMEGVASEAASLAGHLQLGKLIAVSNLFSISPVVIWKANSSFIDL